MASKRKRKAKQVDLEDAIEDGKSPGPGHNEPAELTDDEKRALFFQHKRSYEVALKEEQEAAAVKKSKHAALMAVCKKAKAECGKDTVDDIKDAIQFEAPDGREKFTTEITRKHKVARWLGLPVGTEPSFFDMNDRTPSVELAYDEGKQAGMAGDICKPPHDPSGPQYQKWISGWHDGQAILASAFSKLKTEPVEGAGNDEDVSKQPFAPPVEMPASPAPPG